MNPESLSTEFLNTVAAVTVLLVSFFAILIFRRPSTKTYMQRCTAEFHHLKGIGEECNTMQQLTQFEYSVRRFYAKYQHNVDKAFLDHYESELFKVIEGKTLQPC